MRDLQWGKWRYLNIIREQGSETLTMGEVEVFEYNQGAGWLEIYNGEVEVFEYNQGAGW